MIGNRARKVLRNALLDTEKKQEKDSEIIFNDMYYTLHRNLEKILKEIHVILACDEKHQKYILMC